MDIIELTILIKNHGGVFDWGTDTFTFPADGLVELLREVSEEGIETPQD